MKSVRLPAKITGGHRGFAFVEYLTPIQAAAAFSELSHTHLYGRKLVLEWADEENVLENVKETTKSV